MATYNWLDELERNKGSFPLSGIAKVRNSKIEGVVIHHTEGAPSLSGNLSWAKQKRVGADAYILPDGSFVLATRPDQRMDHAGIKNKSKYGNRNTFSIEVITTEGGMPNAAQYKTTHGLVSRLSTGNGFDIANDVVAHGNIAPGHKNAREGRGIVEMIRTAGLYTEGNDGLYESSAARYSDGRPLMRAQVHPVDLGKPHKGYNPHADGSPAVAHTGDINVPAAGKRRNLHSFTNQRDPFEVAEEKQRFAKDRQVAKQVAESGISDETFLEPEGTPSGLAAASTAPYAAGLSSTSLDQEEPAYEVSSTDTPSVSPETLNALTTPSTTSINTADIVEAGNLQPVPQGGPPVDDLREKAFATAKRYGVADDAEIAELRTQQTQAEEQEKLARAMPVPQPINAGDLFFAPPTLSSATEHKIGEATLAREELAAQTPQLLEYLNTQFNSNNSLVNLVDDAVQNVYNKVRQTYDPDFRIPSEDLQKYPENFHNFLLGSNNAEDYVERTFEVHRRMEGLAVTQRAFDNSGLMWGAGYFSSGIVTMLPYMIVGGGVGAAVTRLLPTGVSFTRYMLTATAADAAVFAPEQYMGMKAGVYDGSDVAMQLIFGAAGSAIGARFITRDAKLQAQFLEMADETAYLAAKEAHAAHGTKMKVASKEAADEMDANEAYFDGLNEFHKPRPIVDEELSRELIRDTNTTADAVRNFDTDAVHIQNFVELSRQGLKRINKKLRADLEAAFDRQAHILTAARSGYLRIPKGQTAESYMKELMKRNEVVYLHRNANEVHLDSNPQLLKIHIPAGRKLLDTSRTGGGTKGSLAVRPTLLVPKAIHGKKKRKALAADKLLTRKVQLTDPATRTKLGQEFDQTDMMVDAPDHRSEWKKQWVSLTAHGARQGEDVLAEANHLKVAHGADFDEKKAFEGMDDWMLKSEPHGGRMANLSAGVMGAKQQAPMSPVKRLKARITPSTRIVQNFFREQEFFTGRKVPLGLGANSVIRAVLPTGLRAEGDVNPLFRALMRNIVEVGYNPTRRELDEGIGNGPSVDRLAQNVTASMDGRIQNAAIKHFEAYRQARAADETGKTRMRWMALERAWIKDFNQDVDDYRRGLQNQNMPHGANALVQDPKYAGVKAYSEELDTYYADMLELAQDPGKLIGRSKEFDPLEGFEELLPQAGYTPRLWSRDLIREVDDRLRDHFDTTDFEDIRFRHMSPLQLWLSDAMYNAGTIQRSEHMMKWARRKAGLKENMPLTLMAPAEKDRLMQVVRGKYDDMARTMGETILRSKEGFNVDVNILMGSFTNKKWLQLLKQEFATSARKWDPDFEAAMKQEIDEILKVGTFTDAAGNTKVDNAGKSGRHSHHRAMLDEKTVVELPDGSGLKLSLKDFANTDQTQIARGYLRRMAGRIAWGSFEYESPAGGITISGIKSDADFKTYIADPIKEVELSVGAGRKDQVIGQSGNKSYIEQELDAVWAATTGQQPIGSEYLSMIQNWSYFAHLGNAGLSQATELGNMIASVGMNHIAAAQPFKDAASALRHARAKGDYDSLDAVASYLMDDGIGFDYVRGAMGSQLDERMGQHAGSGLGSKAMRTSSEALEKGARFVGISSGLTPFQQQMQWTHGRAAFNRVGHMAHKYASWEQMSRRHKQDFVQMFGDEVMAQRVFKMAKNHFVLEDAYGVKRVIDVLETESKEGVPGFDSEAFRRMRNGIKQRTEQNVQTNSYGTSHRWFQNPTVRALMTLKTFIYGSFTKQLLRNGRDVSSLVGQGIGDLKQGNFSAENGLGDTSMAMLGSGGAILYSLGLGALGWMAMSELKLVGKTEDEAEDWRAKNYTSSNLAMAGFQRSGITGLIPTIWNTPAQMFSSDLTLGMEGFKGSGLDAAFTGIPALQDTTRLAKGIYDVATFPMNDEAEWNRENYNRTHKLITNQWMYATVLNAAGGLLFED